MIPAAAGELSEEGEILAPFFCTLGVPGEYRLRGDEPGGMAREADAFVFFRPLAYLFGDVLSDVFGDSLGGGADREQFDTTEPIFGESPCIEIPERPEEGIPGFQPALFSRLIVRDPREVFRPIEPGPDVPFALDNDVVMPGPSFLSFPVPYPFTVEGGEEVRVHAVEAP